MQQPLLGQLRLVLRDERWREGTAERILDHFAVLAGAEQHADGGPFVRLSDVTVHGLEIELQLAQVLRLELADFELDSDKTAQPR